MIFCSEEIPTPLELPVQKRYVAFLGICFSIMYSSYLPAQSLITTFFGDWGFYALVCVYFAFGTASCFSRLFIQVIGVRKTMAFGSLFILLFIGGGITGLPWLLLLVSCLFGGWISWLWVAQAIYISRLTQSTPETIGTINSIFFFFYGLSGLIGNIIIGVIFYVSGTTTLSTEIQTKVLYALLGICVIGCVLLFFVRRVPPSSEESKSILETAKMLFTVIKNEDMFIWIPYLCAWGISIGFGFSQFPLFMEVNNVPWVFALWGVGFLISTILFGQVSGKLSTPLLTVIHACILVLLSVLCLIGELLDVTPLFYVVGFLFGINESLGNNITITALMRTIPKDFSAAIIIWRSEVGYMICLVSLILPFLDWKWVMFIYVFMMILATIIAALLYREPIMEVHNKFPPTETALQENFDGEIKEHNTILSQGFAKV